MMVAKGMKKSADCVSRHISWIGLSVCLVYLYHWSTSENLAKPEANQELVSRHTSHANWNWQSGIAFEDDSINIFGDLLRCSSELPSSSMCLIDGAYHRLIKERYHAGTNGELSCSEWYLCNSSLWTGIGSEQFVVKKAANVLDDQIFIGIWVSWASNSTHQRAFRILSADPSFPSIICFMKILCNCVIGYRYAPSAAWRYHHAQRLFTIHI